MKIGLLHEAHKKRQTEPQKVSCLTQITQQMKKGQTVKWVTVTLEKLSLSRSSALSLSSA